MNSSNNDHLSSLPEPSEEAVKHSNKLQEIIRSVIDKEGGSITFKRYMEMALYEPLLGYYVSGLHKIGAQGDFVTAPEISPLFSQCLANQCQQILKQLSKLGENKNKQTDILEFGAGSGTMMADILLALEKEKALPSNYYIVELSPDLKARQKETVEAKAPHLSHLASWVTNPPDNFNGIILANEVLDAMPVELFTVLPLQDKTNHTHQQASEAETHNTKKTTIFQHHITYDRNDEKKPLQQTLIALNSDADYETHTQYQQDILNRIESLNINTRQPYTSELNPNIDAWMKLLSDSLEKGVILLIDYGYSQSEYYHTDRKHGTLMCHYQHRANEAPLFYPSLQDITASVDFTAVAEASSKAGLDVLAYTIQSHFLANCELEKYFIDAINNPVVENATGDNKETIDPEVHMQKLAQQVRVLSLPAEMGERFKVIALAKNYPAEELMGFKHFNQLHRL